VILLAVVLIAAVAAFMILQRYMVFSADGVRFDLPFLQDQKDPQGPEPGLTATPEPVVVTPDPTPTPVPEGFHPVELPLEALKDGTAADRVAAAGGNAALFDMKGDDGYLSYVSSQQLAKTAWASSSDPEVNDAIRALNGGELYTIARVSCFRDDILPYYRNDLALRSPWGNWRDPDNVRWTTPAKAAVRDYLTGVCVELAELGFDEIWLDNAAYPAVGQVETIREGNNYTPGSLGESIEAFYAQVAQALEPYGVRLSITGGSAAVLEGADAVSGQSLAALADSADRVWMDPDGEEAACAAALEAAGLEDIRLSFVRMGAEAGAMEDSWVILIE